MGDIKKIVLSRKFKKTFVGGSETAKQQFDDSTDALMLVATKLASKIFIPLFLAMVNRDKTIPDYIKEKVNNPKNYPLFDEIDFIVSETEDDKFRGVDFYICCGSLRWYSFGFRTTSVYRHDKAISFFKSGLGDVNIKVENKNYTISECDKIKKGYLDGYLFVWMDYANGTGEILDWVVYDPYIAVTHERFADCQLTPFVDSKKRFIQVPVLSEMGAIILRPSDLDG